MGVVIEFFVSFEVYCIFVYEEVFCYVEVGGREWLDVLGWGRWKNGKEGLVVVV